MEDTIDNDLIARDFKKHPVIAHPHPVFGEVIAETLHITAEIVLQPSQAFDGSPTIHRRQAFEVLFGFRLEFDAVFHKRGRMGACVVNSASISSASQFTLSTPHWRQPSRNS